MEQEHKILWKEFVSTRDTLTSRTNFFLIAEAMMLAAYARIITVGGSDNLCYAFIVTSLLLTGMWLILAGRTYRSLNILNCIIKDKGIFPEYYKWRDLCHASNATNISANTVIARLIPGLIFLLWIVLLFFFLY